MRATLPRSRRSGPSSRPSGSLAPAALTLTERAVRDDLVTVPVRGVVELDVGRDVTIAGGGATALIEARTSSVPNAHLLVAAVAALRDGAREGEDQSEGDAAPRPPLSMWR